MMQKILKFFIQCSEMSTNANTYNVFILCAKHLNGKLHNFFAPSQRNNRYLNNRNIVGVTGFVFIFIVR